MSTFTGTIDCPHLLWSGGKQYECGEEIAIVCEGDSWGEDFVGDLPTACTHEECCDEDGLDARGPYTVTEAKELMRRAVREMDLVEPPTMEPYVPCLCGDHCVC